MTPMDVFALNKESGILSCLECGKCTSVCPVSRIGGTFSPRSMVSRVVTGDTEDLDEDGRMWDCLTCGLCRPRCPHNIDFSMYCRELRAEAVQNGRDGVPSHDGALHHIMELQAVETLAPKRLEWIPKDARVREQGEILYFVGCLPFFDAYFQNLGVRCTEIARSTLRLLNHLDIEPVILPDERCCGHDLLWSGRKEPFLALARMNVEALRRSGVKKILFSCAECYRTLAVDYPRFLGPLDVEMQHLSQFLAEKIEVGALALEGTGEAITYHDPCRLGRQMGVIEEPRAVLRAAAGDRFREMAHHGASALCCGTSSWMNCNLTSKKIQTARLAEAGEAGARVMVTACPKCYVHFTCTQTDETLPEECRVEVKDLCVVAAEALEGAKDRVSGSKETMSISVGG